MRKMYDDRGRVASVFYCDAVGDPVPGPENWHKAVYTYDNSGFPLSISYYDGEGMPCPDRSGLLKVASSRDAMGKELRREEHLKDGRIRLVKWNACGELEERKYVSADGRPVLGNSGYYCMKYAYRDGRVEKQVCFGLDGRKCRNVHGYSALVFQYAKDGSCRKVFLDERGEVIGDDVPMSGGRVAVSPFGENKSTAGKMEKPFPVYRKFQGVRNARGEKIVPRERKKPSSHRSHKILKSSGKPVERPVAPAGESSSSVIRTRRATFYVTSGMLASLLVVFSLVKILPLGMPPVEISVYMVPLEEGVDESPELSMERATRTEHDDSVAAIPEVASVPVLDVNALTDVVLPAVDSDLPLATGSDDLQFGSSLGGGGVGAGAGGIASIVENRCSPKNRMARIKSGGGNPVQVEKAVVGMLCWLKEKQESSGAWGEGGSSVVNSAYPVGTTAICLLAFSAHCETVESEEFGPSIARSIAYLATACMNPGRKTCVYMPGYEYAMAVYAIAESYGLSNEKGEKFPLDEKLLKNFAEHIIQSQSDEGSWDYQYGSSVGDISITCWNVQALCAVRRASVYPDGYEEAMAKAAKYVRSCWLADRGTFHYRTQPRGTNCSIPFVGVYSGRLLGLKYAPKEEEAMKKLVASAPSVNVNKSDYHSIPPNAYVNYYHGQIARLMGGSLWMGYERQVMKNVMTQLKAGKAADRELMSFGEDMPPLTHAFWTLVLSMYYRYME